MAAAPDRLRAAAAERARDAAADVAAAPDRLRARVVRKSHARIHNTGKRVPFWKLWADLNAAASEE